jgi:menaquinone-dependent protoporphyrinogen IX oxidase
MSEQSAIQTAERLALAAEIFRKRHEGQTVVERHTTELVADPSVVEALTVLAEKVSQNTLIIAQLMERMGQTEQRLKVLTEDFDYHEHNIEAELIDGKIVFRKKAA